MRETELFELWRKKATDDPDLIKELDFIENDSLAIKDRFFSELSFGTAGLRGIIGAGTFYMNIYVIRRTTQGLADYLNEKYAAPSVAIGYDSRIKSELFSKEAAMVLAANGIKVHLFPQLQPTPLLSFAIRELGCHAGIVITASHNPSKYNGYKCYGPDGCQMTDESADAVSDKCSRIDYFDDVKTIPFDSGLDNGYINYIGQDLVDSYMENVSAQSINKTAIQSTGLSVIFNPLHGSGLVPVRTALENAGLRNLHIVKEQENPDGAFPTVTAPNPERDECFDLSLKLSKKIPADLLLATDPDCDRVGIAVFDENQYKRLSGNEVGVLLLNYIITQRLKKGNMPRDPLAVKSIVSTNIANEICKKYSVEMRETLTGFKYIGEQILSLEKNGQSRRYIFGFEESSGYLSGTYARDKDAVSASLLIVEMASYYKQQDKTLYSVMQGLYKEYGYYLNHVEEIVREGAEGMAQLAAIMERLRAESPRKIGRIKCIRVTDYLESTMHDLIKDTKEPVAFPPSNVLSYCLDYGNNLIIRPSGTEPKIKIYYTAKGKDKKDAEKILSELTSAVATLLE